jgi:DNA ligase-1
MSEPKDIFMLCESIQEPSELAKLDRTKFKANIKFDGIRCLAIKKEGDIILVSRSGNIITKKFNEVVEAFKKIPSDFMIDGEIIDFSNNFNLLSRRALTKDLNKIKALEQEIPVKFMAFDILSYDNKNIMNEPLTYRNKILKIILEFNTGKNLEIVEYGEIDEMLDKAKSDNGEGIVIKDMNGVYESKRSKNWIKHKLFHETTLTITGYTENNAGIRATDNKENAVQISGYQSNEVKSILDNVGYCEVFIQYLSQSKEGRYRFPSYRGLVK